MCGGAGFEPATVRQFTVFLENRVGRLTLLVRALEESTRIVGLAIEESAEAALARIICADSEAGRYLQVRRDSGSEAWTTISPTDHRRLLQHLTDLYAEGATP